MKLTANRVCHVFLARHRQPQANYRTLIGLWKCSDGQSGNAAFFCLPAGETPSSKYFDYFTPLNQ